MTDSLTGGRARVSEAAQSDVRVHHAPRNRLLRQGGEQHGRAGHTPRRRLAHCQQGAPGVGLFVTVCLCVSLPVRLCLSTCLCLSVCLSVCLSISFCLLTPSCPHVFVVAYTCAWPKRESPRLSALSCHVSAEGYRGDPRAPGAGGLHARYR